VLSSYFAACGVGRRRRFPVARTKPPGGLAPPEETFGQNICALALRSVTSGKPPPTDRGGGAAGLKSRTSAQPGQARLGRERSRPGWGVSAAVRLEFVMIAAVHEFPEQSLTDIECNLPTAMPECAFRNLGVAAGAASRVPNWHHRC